MLTLIRWLLARYRRKKEPTPQEELAEFLTGLRTLSAQELAGSLAVALYAKKSLDTTRMVSMPFPADILDGQLPLDPAASATLTAYAHELKRLRGMCVKDGTVLMLSVARGLDVWIATIWALVLPALSEGKEIWALLAKGEQNVEEAYRFVLRRALSEVERSYLGYSPAILKS